MGERLSKLHKIYHFFFMEIDLKRFNLNYLYFNNIYLFIDVIFPELARRISRKAPINSFSIEEDLIISKTEF